MVKVPWAHSKMERQHQKLIVEPSTAIMQSIIDSTSNPKRTSLSLAFLLSLSLAIVSGCGRSNDASIMVLNESKNSTLEISVNGKTRATVAVGKEATVRAKPGASVSVKRITMLPSRFTDEKVIYQFATEGGDRLSFDYSFTFHGDNKPSEWSSHMNVW